jgi:hypothetical protein
MSLHACALKLERQEQGKLQEKELGEYFWNVLVV